MSNDKILIKLQNIKMQFPVKEKGGFLTKKKYLTAVDDVSFDIYENETFGLVGESGCGKTTLGRIILQLYNQTSGNVFYQDKLLNGVSKKDMRLLRKQLQIVFQDPYSSLNPRFTVAKLISEALIEHKIYKKNDKKLLEYTLDIMEKCGLQRQMVNRYPHQFSGGQRQRIGIARALALKPKFLVCDEPLSTLDVSIRSGIINLLLDLKEKENLTYLFISHDLSTVRFLSDRIGVMYLGKIVELCDTKTLFSSPQHPYTNILLNSIPSIEQKTNRIVSEWGDVPSPVDLPSGCAFHPRCQYATSRCKTEAPKWREHTSGHFIACHYPLIKTTKEDG